MRKLATTLALAALLVLPATAWAQVNQSVIVARDIAGATMTLDGDLTEGVWQNAETIELIWDQNAGGYSSGQQVEGTPTLAEPPDPINATVYLLRDGNKLWIGIDAKDQSIGGNSGFFPWDGVIMAMQNRKSGGIGEFIYSWRRLAGDTTATGEPTPGLDPIPTGSFADRSNPDNVKVWDFRTVANGTSNDDTQTDVGYTMEMTIQMDSLGFDFTKAGGDVAGWSVAIQDLDFISDNTKRFQSRVFWESKWGNTFHGVGYIAGEPGVTVSSGDNATITVGPDLTIPSLSPGGDANITIDGKLDEAAWSMAPVALSLQYGNPELNGMASHLGSSIARQFAPDVNGAAPAPDVVDPSQGDFKMFFSGTKLYVGVTSSDAALSGLAGEDGRDGFRLVIDRADTTRSDGMPFQVRLDFGISGADTVTFDGDVNTYMKRFPGFLEADFTVDGTVDDPTDVDGGWMFEAVIDLTALGYGADLGDNMLHFTPAFFDGDFLQDEANSYATRVWLGRERGQPGVPLFAFLDENTVLARESAGVPGQDLVLYGAQPNPSAGATVVRYDLPEAGDVRLDVYDLLGRRVATVNAGVQSAGAQRAALGTEVLAAGLYLYRVSAQGVSGTTHTATGRLVLAR